MRPKPVVIAHIRVPSWGSIVPVVAIDAGAWYLLDPLGRCREVGHELVDTRHLTVARVAIEATKGGQKRRQAGLDGEVKGEGWRRWSVARRRALLRCVELGWHVVGVPG